MNIPRREKFSPKSLSIIGIPERLHNITVEDLDDYGSSERKEVINIIKKYIDNLDTMKKEGVGIFLFGSNGVGKSFMSCLISKEAFLKRYTVKRCTFIQYINEYTRLWKVSDPKKLEELESLFYYYYKSTDFLVLEELGKEVDTKISAPILEDLLRHREEKGLVTIICTNILPKEVVAKYGASIGSLIKGNFLPIKLTGKDKRIERITNLLR